MPTHKIDLQLDEQLVRRVRQAAVGAVGKSDAEVVEEALTAYVDDCAASLTSDSSAPDDRHR